MGAVKGLACLFVFAMFSLKETTPPWGKCVCQVSTETHHLCPCLKFHVSLASADEVEGLDGTIDLLASARYLRWGPQPPRQR